MKVASGTGTMPSFLEGPSLVEERAGSMANAGWPVRTAFLFANSCMMLVKRGVAGVYMMLMQGSSRFWP